MRCNKCNIDLPEFYTLCPLCNSSVVKEEHKIKDIKTAEFPVIEYKKPKLNIFPAMILLWIISIVVSIVLFTTKIVSPEIFTLIFCAIPVLWTLFIRPFTIKQHYAGNYILTDILPLIMTAFIYGLSTGKNTSYYGECFYLTISFIVTFILLLSIINPEKSYKGSSHILIILVTSAIFAPVSIFPLGTKIYYPVIGIAICILTSSVILMNDKNKYINNIKAYFSIQ